MRRLKDNISYDGIHKWIKKCKGKPTYCEIDKRHFGKRYEWASLSHKAIRNENDFISMCPSCHRIFDKYEMSIENLKKIYA